MKKIIFLFIFVLSCFFLFGQNPSNYLYRATRERVIASKPDSTFHLPAGPVTSLRTGGWTGSGALFYRTTDSSVYVYSGTQWLRLAKISDIGGVGIFVDSIYCRNDSAFYSKSASEYYIEDLACGGGGPPIGVDSLYWKIGGNDFNTYPVDASIFGTKSGHEINVITFDTIRFVIPAEGLLENTGDTTVCLVWDSVSKKLYWQPCSGTPVNIYNSDGTLTNDRNVNADGFYLYFNSVSEFGVGADSVVFNTPIFRIDNLPAGAVTDSLVVWEAATNKVRRIDAASLPYYLSEVDSLVFSTRAWRQKGDDSLAAIIETKLNISDTANNWVNNIWRVPGTDSIYFLKGGITYAVKDSTGGGSTPGIDDVLAVEQATTQNREIRLGTSDTLFIENTNPVNEPPLVIRNTSNPTTYFSRFYNGIIELNYGDGTTPTSYAQGAITHFTSSNNPFTISTPKRFRVIAKGAPRFIVDTTGGIIFSNYGSGTFTGTATKYLAVDAGGNIIEENIPGGSYTDEQAQDAVFNAITANLPIRGVYDDGANTYTLSVDTSVALANSLTTNARLQKLTDSTFVSINAKVNITDTASMLSNYLRGATEGWGINISGTQHKTWTVDSLEAASWYRLYKVTDSLVAAGWNNNFANTNLTLTANRTHSLDGKNLDIINDATSMYMQIRPSKFEYYSELNNGLNFINIEGTAIHNRILLQEQHTNGNNILQMDSTNGFLILNNYQNRDNIINLRLDTMFLNPSLGNLHIDSLDTVTDTTSYKPLVRNAATGRVANSAYWYGGGGGGGSPGGSQYDIQINDGASGFTSDSWFIQGSEMRNNAADLGAYTFQNTGNAIFNAATSAQPFVIKNSTSTRVMYVELSTGGFDWLTDVGGIRFQPNGSIDLFSSGSGSVINFGKTSTLNRMNESGGWSFGATAAATDVGAGNIFLDGFIQLTEISAPGTPSSGLGRLYAKTDGKLYWKDDGGTEYDLTSGTGGGGGSLNDLSDVTITSPAAGQLLRYNGTNWVNYAPTFTLSGNTEIGSSTHTVSLATTANTSVTLPASGTIASFKEATISSNSTWSPSGDARENDYYVTAQAANVTTISAPSGTPANGNTLLIRVRDNGTARTIGGWDSIYREGTNLTFPTTTTANRTMYIKFKYNSSDSRWDLISVLDGI